MINSDNLTQKNEALPLFGDLNMVDTHIPFLPPGKPSTLQANENFNLPRNRYLRPRGFLLVSERAQANLLRLGQGQGREANARGITEKRTPELQTR